MKNSRAFGYGCKAFLKEFIKYQYIYSINTEWNRFNEDKLSRTGLSVIIFRFRIGMRPKGCNACFFMR